MKKRKEKIRVLSVIVALGLMLAGCGSSGSKEMTTEMAAEALAEEAYDASYGNGSSYLSDSTYYATGSTGDVEAEAAAEEAAEYEEGGLENTKELSDTQRKLIRNVNLEVETETFEELLSNIEAKTSELSGYIEESYTYNGSNYYGGGLRNARLTVRIPAENLNSFLSNVEEVSNVVSRNESVTDVTLQYVDMESHKKALQAEQERLLELLERAETLEDIITLESRLSDVRYQIESMESQLRTMDNQVSYSTVYIEVSEVTRLTPVQEQSVWQKISTGFAGSLSSIGNGFVDFGIGFIIALPYLILWAVIIGAAVLIVRGLIKRRRRKKQQLSEDEQTKKEQPQQAQTIQENKEEQNTQQENVSETEKK